MSWLNQPYQGGYPGQPNQQQQARGFQQGLAPQQTGYLPPMQQQRAGFIPQQQQQQPQYQQQFNSSLRPQMPLQGQPTGFMQPSPQPQRPMATGYPGQPGNFNRPPQQQQPLLSQPTGYPGASGGLGGIPGQIGLGSQFLSSFLPSQNITPSAYMDPQQVQFASGQFNAPQQYQQVQQLPQQQQQQQVPIPWALEKDEKKRYDQIFRAWDQGGSGFIMGNVAKEVFGQAGLETDDLMAIWNLADVNDRGKLNIDEFHVAMGLIYRRLNGNPIPTSLPPEMAPPSARDLGDSVDFVSRLLKNDTNQRSTNSSPDGSRTPISYSKVRSFNDQKGQGAGGRTDGTVYRFDEGDEMGVGGGYKSKARYGVDRRDVRPRGESGDDVDDIKSQLKKTKGTLDESYARDEEDEELKDSLRDLKRRIGRVQDDLEYNLSGKRTSAKEDERRKLERELLRLEHEELPELERRRDEVERRKRIEKMKGEKERDDRNKPTSRRFEKDYERSRERDEYRRRSPSRERSGYRRGTYDQSSDEDDSGRYRSKPSSRPRSPPRARTPPPPPPPAPKPAAAAPPPPAPPVPTPAAAPAVPDTKSMTPAERQAYIKAEAQRRIQDRLRALGVSSAPTPDTSVQDRLEQDRQDALKKAQEMDRLNEDKEAARLAKLEREKARGVEIEQSIQKSGKEEEAVKVVRKELERLPTSEGKVAAEAQLDAEEKAILEREKALEREKEERQEKLRRLEREVEEAKAAEEDFIKNKAKFASAAAAPKAAPRPPPSRAKAAPPPPSARTRAPVAHDDDDFSAPAPKASTPLTSPVVAPPAPPAPSPPSIASPPVKSPGSASTNPFLRLGGTTPSATSAASSPVPKPNPFFPPPAAAAPAAPTPAPVKRVVPVDDDDWDSPAGLEKNDESDSSDDEAFGDRNKRANIAQALFGGGGGNSRPSSAQANTPPRSNSTPAPPAAPPAPPAAPAAPRAPPAASAAPAAPAVPPSALLGQIQGGLRLKKTQTKDKSGPAVAGAVIGDASPPVQHYVPPPSPPPAPTTNGHSSREVEPQHEAFKAAPALSTPAEEEEEVAPATLPTIASEEDPMDAVDLKTTIRMRSLYTYDGQRAEDLSFGENLVILANPPKDSSSPWWYGKLESTGKAGWMPSSYVEEIKASPAKALYAYAATSTDEFSFEEDDTLSIVDTSDPSWWKAEKGGVIGLVPATYFEPSPLERKDPLVASEPAPHLSLTIPEVTPSIAQIHPPTPTSRATSAQVDPAREEDDLSSDDDSDTESPDARSPTERERERLRVLEAAGLIVLNDPATTPSPGGPRRRATRRPAPSRPARAAPSVPKLGGEVGGEEVLSPTEPPPEEHQDEHEERMEDAYDIYQRVMRELPPLPNRNSLHESLSSPLAPQFSSPPSPAPSHDSQPRQSVTGSFLSRVVAGVSRTSTSATGDKPRPIVSSPVISAPSTEANQSSSNIGMSWASLIDPSALANVPDKERKRQESIFEFITTEQTYVKSLQLIIEVFYAKLQTLLTQKASQIIFANIEDIMMFNTIFLSELEDRQRESRLYVDTIGDIVKSHMKGLDVYRGYCVNQSNAAATLADLKASDPNLRGALETLRVKSLELEHFLLEPMQRLTRYPLLINQIIKYTEAEHSDHAALEAAHRTASNILGMVNEAVRVRENEEKLAMLTDHLQFVGVDARLELTAPTRYLGPRQIIREGNLNKAKSGRALQAYLFNDLLLFTETKTGGVEMVYRWPIPLDECTVRDSKKDDAGFQIAHRGEAISVRAGSARQALVWIKDIKEAQEVCLAAIAKKRRGGV